MALESSNGHLGRHVIRSLPREFSLLGKSVFSFHLKAVSGVADKQSLTFSKYFEKRCGNLATFWRACHCGRVFCFLV